MTERPFGYWRLRRSRAPASCRLARGVRSRLASWARGSARHGKPRFTRASRKALVEATERDTTLIFRTLHNTGRVMKNVVSSEVVATENRPGGCEFKDIQHLVSGARGREALQSGDVTAGLVWAGQVVGLIDDIPTCAELIERMVTECREHLARARELTA